MSGIDLASSDETKQKVALKEALGGAADPDGAAKLSHTPTVSEPAELCAAPWFIDFMKHYTSSRNLRMNGSCFTRREACKRKTQTDKTTI